jgi:hypothetical protein
MTDVGRGMMDDGVKAVVLLLLGTLEEGGGGETEGLLVESAEDNVVVGLGAAEGC